MWMYFSVESIVVVHYICFVLKDDLYEFEDAGDHYLGRVVAGLPLDDAIFSTSCILTAINLLLLRLLLYKFCLV